LSQAFAPASLLFGKNVAAAAKQGVEPMLSDSSPAESLRKAIENLINVKLHDALAKPGGLDRLVAHRSMGVASFAVRQAERHLEETLAEVLPTETLAGHDA
jgi:hypothetical protein